MISIVLGTRPEIIKMAPIIRECERRGTPYQILHTGQHYSYEMDRTFFDGLELPDAHHNLDVGSGSHAAMTGDIMKGIEKLYTRERPSEVLVQGDTNTVLGGALVGAKMHIRVGHVEAGLRSFDRSMPEEVNRVVADHVSDHLFAPTELSRKLLLKEGIPDENIFVTGNTIVDSVMENLEISRKAADPLKELGLSDKRYLLVTAHRAENVDVESRLSGILSGISRLGSEFDLPVIYPIHPRAKKMIGSFGLDTKGIELITPVGFLEFLRLESSARLVLTDSGGLQEETCILGVPCVTLRDNTERPETIDVGSNVLSGTDPDNIVKMGRQMMNVKGTWDNPFGDGRAGKRILDIVQG